MSKQLIQATTLRMMIFTLLVTIILVSLGGFFVTAGWLNELATGSTSSSSTPNSQQILIEQKNDLKNQKNAATKAINMFTEKQGYQNQVAQDLNTYAAKTGVSIASVSVSQAQPNYLLTQYSGNIQPDFLSVKINNPVNYNNLLKFIIAIESNLPKMKLTGISLSRAVTASDSVNVEPLTIEVYSR